MTTPLRRRPLTFQLNVVALAPLVLVAAVLAVPYLFTHNLAAIGFALQRAFALICHQRPERSFWIYGMPVAVCARCLGIYVGAAIGLLLLTSHRAAVNFFAAIVALNLLDALAEFAGLHGNWSGARFLLGVLLGAAGGLLISSSLRIRARVPRVSATQP